MKKTFKEFYPLTKSEIKSLRKNCIFIFDANFLLNLYEYSKKTIEKLIDILKDLKEKKRIWIPYQFAYEYQKNRLNTIRKLQRSCDRVLQEFDKLNKNNAYLEIDKETSEIKKIIQEKNKFYDNLYKKDTIRDSLTSVFNGNVGLFKEDIEKKVYEEGPERYAKNKVPGCKDSKKPIYERYGDLLGWRQIIEYAKASKKPIVFVTDDEKDWRWMTYDEKIISGAHYQLIKDIKDETGVLFSIYNTEEFINFIRKKVKKDIIEEIKKTGKKRYIKEEESIVASSPSEESINNLSSSDIQTIEKKDVGEAKSS